MDSLMQGMEFWHWFVAGLVLITIEMFMPGAFYLGMGLAAFIIGGVLWAVPGFDWEYQIMGFAVLSLLAVLLLRRFLKARPIETDQPLLNQRGKQYVGRTFTLDAPIENGYGKIKVDDTTWKVEAEDCPAGTKVEITGVDGTILKGRISE